MSAPEFLPAIDLTRRTVNPPLRVWLWHLFWFLVTFVTTTATGAKSLFALGHLFEERLPPASTWLESLWQLTLLPGLYVTIVGELFLSLPYNAPALENGFSYSLPLLFILLCHEAGHYIACRIYKVEATLPLFLPSPPLVGVGTFGAFIRIMSPMPSRKAVFDIGVAGPLAGFVALIPIAFIGVYNATPAPPGPPAEIVLSDPLLLRLIAWAMNVDLANSVAGPFYMAAWIGLLVTSLNLIPSGQLDGGHAVYAVFGRKLHMLSSKMAFVVMFVIAILGIYLYNSPAGILFVVILAIMLRLGHPEPYYETPLDKKRLLIAAITLVVFILSFVPFPIQINF